MPPNQSSRPARQGTRDRLPSRLVRRRRTPGTLTGILQQRASRNPSGVPMVIPGLDGRPDTRVTYAEIERRTLAVAAHLERATDINPGERVMVSGLAGPDYLAGMLGVMLAGCIAVPAPPPLLPQLTQRCRVIVRDCDPAGILITGGLQGLVSDGLDSLLSVRDTLLVAYISAMPDAPDGWVPSSPPQPGDTAYIQYTSGTTGDPQGAVFTHKAACAGTTMTAAHIRLTPGTPSASMLPPWHDLGLGALWLAMHGRSPLMITQPHDWIADPVGWLAELSRRKVEIAPVPSFAFSAITARLNRSTADERARLSLWLRLILTGAEPADPADPEEFTEALADSGLHENPARWLYGAAEAVGAVTGQPPDESVLDVTADPGYLAAGRIVPGTRETGIRLHTAGRPLRKTRVRARRLDGDGFCAAGEIGEVLMQGPQLAAGYWRGTGGPWTTIEGERWMSIGDLGAVMEDGTLVLLGRRSDMITIRAGERTVRRYFPFLLEQAAARSAGRAVRSHRIIAFQDSDGGIVIAAEPRPGANLSAAADAIRGALVREYGVVAHVTFTAPGAIEVTTSGKARRARFAQAYQAGELEFRETEQQEAA